MSDDAQADTVIEEYLKVLEKKSYRMMFGLPEKFLPYTAKAIKEAIRQKLALVLVARRQDKELIEKLKAAYVELAKFVPFKEFGLNDDLYAEGPAKFFQAASQAEKSKALKITEKIRRDRDLLQKEIEAWCRDFRI